MLHQIGIGTLGPVFRTYEPSRDRLIAVKAFRLDIVPEQAQALALALDRAAHASLFHPSIVEPIDAGVEGTVAYRAEEYVAAESLDVAMRHYAPASIEKVLPFITQLAGAIDFARAAGIGHGGLHPRDIFVTPDEARATGFGVVDALEQIGIRAPIRRPYSAPERIAGSAWSTPADVFSLAAITFELLTGKRPSGTGEEIGLVPDGPHARGIHAVLARAMDDEASRRYGHALGFAAALEAAAEGRTISDAVQTVIPLAGSAEAAGSLLPPPPDASAPEPTVVIRAAVDDDRTLKSTAHAADLLDYQPEAPTLGEFAVEAELDPVHAALDDLTIPHDSPPTPTPISLFAATATEPVHDAFADEAPTEPQLQMPLAVEAPDDDTAPALVAGGLPPEAPRRTVAEPAMFGVVAAEADPHEPVETARPAILPYAVVAVPMLLVGFAGGYFVGSRDRIPQESVQTTTSVPAAAGAQAHDTARPFSDEKVTPPAPPRPDAGAAPESKAPVRPIETKPPAPVEAAPPAKAAPVASVKKGQLVVRSLPTNAGVTVNGKWRGRTPITIDDLNFGDYTIRVVQPGYRVMRDEFSLSAHAPSRTVTAHLERVPLAPVTAPPPAGHQAPASGDEAAVSFTGSLYVDSRPRGAIVFVDGKSVGQTPLSVPEMPVGSHVVRIEMEGKKPVNANPRISAGKTERITVSLEDKEQAPMPVEAAPVGKGRR
ncbi:MAG TPA: PEGA domain-containing protein [Vicinamibacterales bacterium]